MKREMKHKTRATQDFQDSICNVYKETTSCRITSIKISAKYNFAVSMEYVSKILHKRGLKPKGNGRKVYTMYDTQLGRTP